LLNTENNISSFTIFMLSHSWLWHHPSSDTRASRSYSCICTWPHS